MTTPKIFSGLDLLDKVIEFTDMTRDPNDWNSAALKSNPPRLIRLKQICALTKAFLPDSYHSNNSRATIDAILSGSFISNKTVEDYTELTAFITAFVQEQAGEITYMRLMQINRLTMPYTQLLEYKKLLKSLLTFNSTWLEASSITAWFSIFLTNSITSNLEGKYSKLDQALELFINPRHLQFTEKELIAGYGYPTEDLGEIDMDFI